MEENESWVPQEDGTYQPSEKLMKAIREDPARFPHAVDDISSLSGKSRDEVQAIIDNPYEQSAVLGATVGAGVDVVQGLGTGAGIAMEKVGAGLESLGATNVGPSLAEAGKATKDYVESMDPKFDTEKGLIETGLEVVGQVAPAVAGAVAAAPATMGAGAALVTSSVAGAGVGYFTFENEDNLIQLADEVTGGAMPDFLVINPETDDEETQHLKGMAAMVISELATAGLVGGIGKIYKAFKGGGNAAAAKAAQEAAEEAGIEVAMSSVDEAIGAGQLAVSKVSRETVANRPTVKEADQLMRKEAAAVNKTAVASKQAGAKVEHPFNMGDYDQFRRDSLGTLNKTFDNIRTRGDKAAVKLVDDFTANTQAREALDTVVRTAYEAASSGDFAQMRRIVDETKIDGLRPEMVTNLTQDILRGTLARLDARYDDIVKMIRTKPELRTNAAYKEVLDDLFAQKRGVYEGMVSLGIKDRTVGTTLSLGLLSRRYGFSADEDFMQKMTTEANEFLKANKDNPYAYDIRSTNAEVREAMERRFSDLGINPVDAVDVIDTLFDEFDKMRQAAINGVKGNTSFGMSEAQRKAMEGSYWKAVQDLHGSALLGQLSTTGLEVFSNTAQNALLPLANILGRSDLNLFQGIKRAASEYLGYKASTKYAFGNMYRTFKSGVDEFNRFDMMEGSHSSLLDYEKLAKEGKWIKYGMTRLWKSAADMSIAASSSMKTMRGFGIAYADGYEAAIKSGLSKPAAKKAAKEYAASLFDENGRILDKAVEMRVEKSSWQSKMDTRYITGKLGQYVENHRNSENGLVATASRAIIPFFRTLVNIGSDAMQTSLPIPGELLKVMDTTIGKVSGKHPLKAAKFLDDFSGRNGAEAAMAAKARQRAGFAVMGSVMALQEAGVIQITPPGGFQSWDAKQAQWTTKPGTSVIIGDTAVDLTRGLPFTAPIILAGILYDQVRDHKLDMENGQYVPDPDAAGMLGMGMVGYGTLLLSLMSDLGAMRGVGDTFDAFASAAESGDLSQFGRILTNYGKGFTPGLIRMYGKNRALLTGDDTDWDQYKGENFIEELMAASGFKAGYKRVDFLGKPLRDPMRGLDPFNMKPVKINDDPVYEEYAILSQDADFGISPGNPDKIFDKTFWKRLGVNTDQNFLEGIVSAKPHSINQFKLKNGMNAYEAYRRMIYEGRVTSDVEKSTGRYGDRINIGKVGVMKGESFEDAIRRTIEAPGYERLTPEARQKVWQTIFGIFKSEAKDYVGKNMVIDPEMFNKSTYGSPIEGPTTLKDTEKVGKELAKNIQTTKGVPQNLDELFSIK